MIASLQNNGIKILLRKKLFRNRIALKGYEPSRIIISYYRQKMIFLKRRYGLEDMFKQMLNVSMQHLNITYLKPISNE